MLASGEPVPLIGFVVGLAGALVAWWWHSGWQPRRVIFMQSAARDLGLMYRHGDPENLEFVPFPLFSGWGAASSGILHTLSGERNGTDVHVVDYWWKESTDEWYLPNIINVMCAIVALEASMPPTVIYHGSAASDFEMPVQVGEPVWLELEEFQDEFRVRSEDPRFANAFLDQRMMEFLLEHQEYQFEVAQYGLLVVAPRGKKLVDIRALFDVAEGFRAHVPRVIPGLFPLSSP